MKIIVVLLVIFIFSTVSLVIKLNNNDKKSGKNIINVSYFSNNFDEFYRGLSFKEKSILDNTIIKIDSYVNDYGMIEYGIQKELFKYYDKEILTKDELKNFTKLYYLSLRDIHDLKLIEYDEDISIDNDVYSFLEGIVNE
ncbi:MAG: hypothetical protein GY828_06420 [Candidatus Gracilibacteria bacterium]|nr:hypothetical protein [Candidatus Gracilibacteria bacterium]